ncbi:MAG: hypothetical protein LBQ80_02840 [Clostridium sp.]|jgi:hypothetical protein|nr:hypothetical protein [Clostridium sp.]
MCYNKHGKRCLANFNRKKVIPMWGDLGWFSEFVEATIDMIRGWFSGVDASDATHGAFDTWQESFTAWLDSIVTGRIRDFLVQVTP